MSNTQMLGGGGDGSIPTDVVETLTSDDGIATASSNNINVLGGYTNENNANGIKTEAVGDTLDVKLTNRFKGDAVTNNSSPTNILVIGPTVADSVFTIQATFCGIKAAAPQGAVGYNIFATIRTDGVSCSLVGTPDKIVNEDNGSGGSTDMTDCDANILVAGNTVQFEIIGLAGTTINWNMVATYTEAP